MYRNIQNLGRFPFHIQQGSYSVWHESQMHTNADKWHEEVVLRSPGHEWPWSGEKEALPAHYMFCLGDMTGWQMKPQWYPLISQDLFSIGESNLCHQERERRNIGRRQAAGPRPLSEVFNNLLLGWCLKLPEWDMCNPRHTYSSWSYLRMA